MFTPTIVCLSLAIFVRIYDNSKINHPCSTVCHSFDSVSFPYCFRFTIGEQYGNNTENDTETIRRTIRKRYGCLLSIKACYKELPRYNDTYLGVAYYDFY